ncbi:hypothetical protein [Endozoicomonas ascidiicola]|uniref:hypothetical protein n=1 Tax=Endozoicomonas ascidiicola TaxID=1698521 RepID=UPI00082E61B8|nr:hypothetical protein [Endozoicomonas ascidiicola]
MLNEDLYECLVELGINEHKARKAAKENAELLEMSADIVTVRQTLFELTRQSCGMNERLINVEALIKALVQRINAMEQWQTQTSQHLSGLDQTLGGVEGKLSTAMGKLSSVEERLTHVEIELTDIKSMLTLLVEKQ